MSVNQLARVNQELDRVMRESTYAVRNALQAAGSAGPLPTQTITRTFRVTTASDGVKRALTVALTVTELTGAAITSATPAVTDDVVSN